MKKKGLIKKNKSLCVAALLACVFFSCGRKALPVPPGVPELLPVSSIFYEIKGARVKLSWDKPEGESFSVLKSYSVHRSKTGVDKKECEGCPVLFQRIAELDRDTNEYDELIETGYNYIYKVVARSKYETISPDSDFIRFKY